MTAAWHCQEGGSGSSALVTWLLQVLMLVVPVLVVLVSPSQAQGATDEQQVWKDQPV